jgi:ketosteroid isomerase-like protein
MLTACGGGGNPESVALDFQKAVMNGDFEEAVKYATENTAPMLKRMASMGGAEEMKGVKEEFKNTKVAVKSSEIDEEAGTAIVTLELTNADGDTDIARYDLIKENGSWKVIFKK